MARKIIIEADTKLEAIKEFRKRKRIIINGKIVKAIPTSARKTNREGIFEVTFRRRKRK